MAGDAYERTCEAHCKLTDKEDCCAQCVCAACSFCGGAPTYAEINTSTLLRQRAASRAAASEARERFLRTGVVVRLFECSLVGCLAPSAPDVLFERCVRNEMDIGLETARPASMLRWDLPAALFIGGRCTSPTSVESHLFPKTRDALARNSLRWKLAPDSSGWRTSGFSGHNVTQAGVGWLLSDVPVSRRGVAFPHDAWQYKPGVGLHRSGSCDQPRAHRSPEAYAQARLAASNNYVRNESTAHSKQQMAAAFQRFVRSRWNCYYSEWELAFADQRAYAALVSSQETRNVSHVPECGVYGSLCMPLPQTALEPTKHTDSTRWRDTRPDAVSKHSVHSCLHPQALPYSMLRPCSLDCTRLITPTLNAGSDHAVRDAHLVLVFRQPGARVVEPLNDLGTFLRE